MADPANRVDSDSRFYIGDIDLVAKEDDRASLYAVKKESAAKGGNGSENRGKRLLPFIVLVVTILVIGGLTLVYLNMDVNVFPLRYMSVESDLKKVDVDDVKAIVEPAYGKGVFLLNAAQIRNSLIKHPWIKDADVRIRWPDTLLLNISEQYPAAIWKSGRLISVDGEIFAPEDFAVASKGLAKISGPEEIGKQVIEKYLQYKKQLEEQRLKIVSMEIDKRRSEKIVLSNGIMIMLGKEDGSKRLNRFIKVYSKAIKDRVEKIGMVDFRYANGFAVAWKKNSNNKLNKGQEE